MNIFSELETWKRNLTSNDARLDSQSDDPHLRPVVVSRSASAVADQIVEWATQQANWSVESQQEQSSGSITLHLTRKTSIMRFIDDIHVQLHSEGDRTRVEAESRSRFGVGDLGQNPRNLRELVGALDE